MLKYWQKKLINYRLKLGLEELRIYEVQSPSNIGVSSKYLLTDGHLFYTSFLRLLFISKVNIYICFRWNYSESVHLIVENLRKVPRQQNWNLRTSQQNITVDEI